MHHASPRLVTERRFGLPAVDENLHVAAGPRGVGVLFRGDDGFHCRVAPVEPRLRKLDAGSEVPRPVVDQDDAELVDVRRVVVAELAERQVEVAVVLEVEEVRGAVPPVLGGRVVQQPRPWFSMKWLVKFSPPELSIQRSTSPSPSMSPTAAALMCTTRQLHTHILARHRLREEDYTLGQLRYDLGKLRAHGLVERVGRSRRYRLTPDGVRLGALLVKIRTRLLGPLFADSTHTPTPRSDNPSTVEAAMRTVDRALDTLCATLGLSAEAA